jgi:ribosomal protein S18 acetylase RimI-like enzyme
VSVSIRRAGESEATSLAPLLTALCRRSKASWGYPPELMARWADDLRIEPDDIVRDIVLAAETQAGAIEGFARVSVRADHSQLKDLWVDPPAMGQGIGRALWDAAVVAARALPFDELRLAADPNAEAFYERMGARRIGEVESEVVNGRRLPLMGFDLRATSG